jgi:hypothetical protein
MHFLLFLALFIHYLVYGYSEGSNISPKRFKKVLDVNVFPKGEMSSRKIKVPISQPAMRIGIEKLNLFVCAKF